MASESPSRRVVSGSATLAPPANEELIRLAMERSPSATMRSEKEDLKEAAEDSYNVIMDLDLDGKIRWVSASWDTVIGTPKESIIGKPIADILVDDKHAFQNAVEVMKNDDSRSYKFRFAVAMGSMSTLSRGRSSPDEEAVEYSDDGTSPIEGSAEDATITLEGQGILIYDRSTGEPSHTMWVVRPYVEPTEITIDLPPVLVESLGVGAGMLARYLTSLAEQGNGDPANHPPPLPVLCRICERQIQPWWFEKHSELCMLEHKAESDVQLCQENLGMHRQALVRILDAMERRSSSRPLSIVSAESSPATPPIEYRGYSIGPSSSSPSGTSSPSTPPPGRARDQSASGARSRSSFAPRRPLVRIVELLLDLCDTAMEISTPVIKEPYGSELGTFRTQSPESEARISQVMQWQSPSTNTLEEEKGLALLCQDTEAAAKAKVEAVFRHRNTIEYSERIRLEFSMLVQDCIDEAVRKATEMANEEAFEEDYCSEADEEEPFFEGSFENTLQRSNSILTEPSERARRLSSTAMDSGRSSPMECSTPKSTHSIHRAPSHRRVRHSRHSRHSMHFEAEGGDSDTSAKSSLAAAMNHVPTDSPVSDHELSARISSRDRSARHSMYQASVGSNSPKRAQSPARMPPASSPLRIAKPRNSMYEPLPTPMTSPLLSTGDFSPALEHSFHHRRQSSATFSDQFMKSGTPASPHLSGVNPSQQNRAVPPSIKDFEIIKPISKGAFGSVYLSKKKSTGDYFAIKVLKKADMIAKNQVTNVRAERAIMMVQGESDFVAKLFWTFASKDYLYLVMEYLNGGDCAALIKVLGGLPEEWAKKYMAEVVLGVENLHARGIVHRDLKPDNLLIDQKGHLKLTDFGLSRMGLVGRQKRAQTQTSDSTPDLLKQGPFSPNNAGITNKSMASSRSTSFDFPTSSPSQTPSMTPDTNAQLITPSYFNLNRENTLSRESSLRRSSNGRSETSGSDHLATMLGNFTLSDPPTTHPNYSARRTGVEDDTRSESSTSSDFSALGLHHVNSNISQQSQVSQSTSTMMPPQLALFDPEDNNNRKFVGTPDYLAPETIKGTGQDETSDWWSLGCILFEFLYGYPPFHADTPEEVFENILARRIAWPDEEEDDASDEAKDLMNRLMCTEQKDRLGANGAQEVKDHPFFVDVNWDTLLQEEPQFVPTPQNPEDTEYFDARGATLQSFVEEMEDQSSMPSTPGGDMLDRPFDAVSRVRKEINSNKRGLIPLSIPPHVREGRNRRLSEPMAQDDFGSFTFKNLPVLEKANKDVIQKLRTEALKSTPALTTSNPTSPLDSSPSNSHKPLSRAMSTSSAKSGKRAVSPSGMNRPSQPSSPLLVSFSAGQGAGRKGSNSSATSITVGSLPTASLDPPRLATAKSQPVSMAASPIKQHAKLVPPQSVSTSPNKTTSEKPPYTPVSNSGSAVTHNPRMRSLTVGSTDSEGQSPPIIESFHKHTHKRRSQVFDMSPSSSDNEEVRSSALLRVQRRRQSARRMSNISFQDGPQFRPLDVLVCEDHPVSRMVMERLLEKLKCRTIGVDNGAEAMRCAMGEVKFDIILMEFKLPQISGEDVARMIRTSRNPNSNTPIVAVTGYLKDLSDPHHFDELMEKPATPSKLIDVLERQCFWKPPPPERDGLGERKVSSNVHRQALIDARTPQPPAPQPFLGNPREFVRGFKPEDDDNSSVVSSVDGGLSRTNSSDWTNTRPPLSQTASSSSIKSELSSSNTIVRTTPATLLSQESAPPRLQPPAAERIPSPLSVHVSADSPDDNRAHLTPQSELTPLPPSLTSTPVFNRPGSEGSPRRFASLSAFGVVNQSLRRSPPQSPVDSEKAEISKKSPREEKPKSSFSLFPSSKDKNKEKEHGPPNSAGRSVSPPIDIKTKSKRSSLEKKKDKHGKWKEGSLNEETDADDEDSLCGGKKPSKSRSIREMIQAVKRSPESKKDFHDTVD
ncbi:hypothetical protein EX30DRAFT_69156 [Ascodesmis nigricans]|uniref:non-specific serine/threonine protein kinase n=1 Tax=Ascodesmis nigricans TaxID=341454 RepID=A0A4S2MU96_9PEZI|nr:hypothetical protein EX30DRAFT_69156 [Ascodesmis nigricans]